MALHIDNLQCVRSERILFSAFDLSIEAGHAVHLQGANGVGKTTLMRTIAGLHPHESGQILWQQKPLHESIECVHYLGHKNALKAEMSALENIDFYLRFKGVNTDENQRLQCLKDLSLNVGLEQPVKAMSQGQQRKVALAVMLLSQAQLWLLDEPLVALDVETVKVLEQCIEAHLQQGGSLLLTSHQALNLDAERLKTVDLNAYVH